MSYDGKDSLAFREWSIFLEVIFYRGRIGFDNSMSFIIHTNEKGHNKPHLHAKYQNKEVVIEIPSGEIIAGNLSGNMNQRASKWVVANSEYLKSKWNELTNGVKIPINE